jgi:coat protein Gp5
MSSFIKAEKVVSTSLGLLIRELVLPRLVWRDAKFDYTGAKDDTISLRLPAYAPARTRALRSGDARVKDNLTETKVDVTLDTDVYKDIGISDEELTLDIANFGEQVLNPVVQGIGLQLEQEIADVITGAEYQNTIAYTYSSGEPYADIALEARALLSNAHVPLAGRVLAVGSNIEKEFLGSTKFNEADKSGSTETLREAIIGRVAGFDVVSVPSFDPDEAYAFHRTAYAMSQRAPIVPSGAPWGATQSYQGLAIRTVRVFDPNEVEDRFVADSWIGATAVTDDGYFDANGKFVPTSGDNTVGPAITLAESEADDDIIDTATAHGFVAGDKVRFPALTGGAGLSKDTDYYVIAANLAARTFQVSTTKGGSAALFTTDITAGTVSEEARPMMVRSVKVVGS